MAAGWDSALYEDRFSFVWKHGADLLPLLDAREGERILDLGCGTGHLTARIGESGAHVTGLDNSAEMIEQARRNFPEIVFQLAEATGFSFPEPFDAVFSNAVLHWVKNAEAAVRSVARSLKPGGRFVAEFGGQGNVQHILDGVLAALRRRGYPGGNPWYFPSVGEYTTLLESQGFEIRYASLFDRPTPLEDPAGGVGGGPGGSGSVGGPGSLRQWIEMFGRELLRPVPAAEQEALFREVDDLLRPFLFRDGRWFVDYRRIRVAAILP